MMASSSIVDGLKVVHLLYGPATEVLKQLLANQLHRKYFKDKEKTIKQKLKVSEVRKIYPFDNKNEKSLLQALDDDCLETLLQLMGIPYSDGEDRKTIHDLITVNLLQKHLDEHERKLKGLNEKKKVLCKAQWANLFPVTRKKWTDSFDITLLCFILFESFDVKPTNMKNSPPADNDTELGDDVERIRYYRNTVIHGNFLENKHFSFQWDSICRVIIRRGGSRYRDKIEDIQCKDLDPYLKQSYEELIKECQLQETIRCKTVEKLEKDIEDAKCDMKATIDTSATQVQKVVEYEAQEVKKEVRKSDSKIREKITEQVSEMKKVMGEQQKEYSSTVNSTLQSYEHKATETMDKAFQKYTDLVSEKIKQSQQTGANSEVSLSTILSSVQKEIKPVIQKEMKEMTDNVRLNESDSLRIVMNDVHSLVQKMNDYIETNRAFDQTIGKNVTPRLLQVGVKCDAVVKKLETFEKTHQQDKRDSSEHDKQMREQLDQKNGDFQGLAREMTTTSTDIKLIKVAMDDIHEQIRGETVGDPTPPSYQPQSPDQNAEELQTSEGLKIKIYIGSILHLGVDCIVNAANEYLQHAISKAAGYDFDKESREFIKQNGPLGVGKCCKTSAGKLQYKGVIRAVGPRWRPKDQMNCLNELKEAVKNILMECDSQGFKSVAIPAISSGTFGVPKDLCAQEYYRGVVEYSKQRNNSCSLREVHFVDKDPGMILQIHQTFTTAFATVSPSSQIKSMSDTSSSNDLATSHMGNIPIRDPSSPQDSKTLSFSWESQDFNNFFQFDNMGVDIVDDDIIDVDTEAIVFPEDIRCSGQGHMTKDIADQAGASFQSFHRSIVQQKQNLAITKVFHMRTGDAKWDHILLTMVPVWKDYSANTTRFREDVKNTYLSIFNSMESLNIDDIAIQIIGADTGNVPVVVLAEGFYYACKEYSSVSKPVYLKIFITAKDKDLVRGLCKAMNDLEEGKTPKGSSSIKEFNGNSPIKNNDGSISGGAFRGTTSIKDNGGNIYVSESTGSQEDCSICMDKVTDPKQLRCGHVFCKICIEQYFQYKPMCPTCGAVYGKSIGDQPEGTIRISTSRFDHLQGYKKDGVIKVTYHFPAGKQGENHPNPGRPYESIQRIGYLPNNKRGKLVSKLLKIAFDRKLVFTIGNSRTTGEEGVVTWNDIHHKTRKEGGPQRFGYPDPDYLDRVMDELAAKGVTEESLKDP